jgi:hypothetical protein
LFGGTLAAKKLMIRPVAAQRDHKKMTPPQETRLRACPGRNHEQVHRRDAVSMIAQKRPPALGWRPSTLGHVFGDRGLADIDAELEELTVDALARYRVSDKTPLFFGHFSLVDRCGVTLSSSRNATGMRPRQSFGVCVNASVPTLGLLAFPAPSTRSRDAARHAAGKIRRPYQRA